jgi:hypothetical protein
MVDAVRSWRKPANACYHAAPPFLTVYFSIAPPSKLCGASVFSIAMQGFSAIFKFTVLCALVLSYWYTERRYLAHIKVV